MTKKKKTASKQSKQNLPKPSAKAGKDAAPSKKFQPESADKPAIDKVEVDKQSDKAVEPASKAPVKDAAKEQVKEVAEAAGKDAAKAPSKETSNESAKSVAEEKKAPEAKVSEAKTSGAKSSEAKTPAKESGKGAKGKKKGKPAKSSAGSEAVSETSPETPTEVAQENVSETVSEKPAETAPETTPEAAPEALPDAESSKAEPAENQKRVAKTLIDTEVPAATAAPEEPRKIAKTMLEVDIGSLQQSAAKATGADPSAEVPKDSAPPQGRKVAKTLMDFNATGLRDSVEAASRAIEDEIAAAIKESEQESASQTAVPEPSERAAEPAVDQQAASAKPKVSEDRKVAKTMLDVRTQDLFELANFEGDTLAEDDVPLSEQSAAETPEQSSEPAAQAAQTQPRKVAKTMLEVDAPDVNAILAAANQPASAQQTDFGTTDSSVSEAPDSDVSSQSASQADERRGGTDEVSLDDLSDFAAALREDKPMAPPMPRAERLRKTLMGIRQRGLSSRASLPNIEYRADASEQSGSQSEIPAPVQIARSLHPLDNFSFDDVADETSHGAEAVASHDFAPEQQYSEDSYAEAQSSEQYSAGSDDNQDQSFAPDDELASSDQLPAVRNRTGTVQMDIDPHAADGETGFKGTTTVWPHDQENASEEHPRTGSVKPERFVAKTMLDMDFLKESLSASVSRAEEKLAESIAQKAAEPPKQTLTQDDYKIATPGCPFTWADGDMTKDRVRYCTQCNAQVYNFAGFDLQETNALIFSRENRENAKIFKREDGKFMTQDCPMAVKKAKDRGMLVGGGILLVVLVVVTIVMSLLAPKPTVTEAAPDPSEMPSTTTSIDGSLMDKSSSGTGSSTSGTGGTSSTGATAGSPGAYGDNGAHYVKGKGMVVAPQPAPVQLPPPVKDNSVPGTTSGYDEGGQFWKYTDQGNNTEPGR